MKFQQNKYANNLAGMTPIIIKKAFYATLLYSKSNPEIFIIE